MMQVTGTRDIKGNTGKVPNPACEHHVSGSYFSVTYDWGLHSDVLTRNSSVIDSLWST